MSLLDDLRLDIGDDDIAPVNSGVTTQVASSTSPLLVRHLRLDIGDDINLIVSSGAQQVGDTEIDGYLQIQDEAYFCGAQYWNTREITAAGDIVINESDHIVLINKTVGSPTNVLLPFDVNAFCGQRVVNIKDKKGDAHLNPISITSSFGLIDGQVTITINNPYQSFTFIRGSDGWSIL